METTAHLWLFFGVVLGVVVLPGLDMAFVLASSLAGGRRIGFCAVAGIVAGSIGHVAMGTLGVAVVLQTVPIAFNTLLAAGTLYVAWIGVGLLRVRATGAGPADPVPVVAAPSAVTTLTQGALTNLLNPKAYLFMLAVFPQFLRPDRGPLWQQALVLGGIIFAAQISVYGSLALLAARAGRGWAASARSRTLLARTVGAVLVLAALVTLVESWRGA